MLQCTTPRQLFAHSLPDPASPLVTLTFTFRYWTLIVPFEPGNRVIHVLNVLALQTERWEIRHTTNVRIRALFRTIRAWNAHNLHADSAAGEMSAALGTTETRVHT